MAIKCPKCQAENPETKQFCADCGTRLGLPEAPQISVTRTLETTTDELPRGVVFAGRYEIIEELGTGGMGRVYRAQDTKLNEEIALKLIKPEIAANKRTVERFRNELKTARKIRHKNVCGMYDFHEEGKTLYLTMEYVRGEDLKSLLHRMKTLPVGTALSIAHQIAEGLGEAHKLGIVHRDLKPGNIMIDKDGQAKVMDFGIARSLLGKGLTGEGAIIGTPEYMSPEQVEGKEADQRADIYALGIILFEMVTGRLPFEGETPFSIATKHKTEPPPIPKKLVPQIPEGLNKLILRCLEKDRAKRYQTAEELIADISAVEQALPVTDRVLPVRKPLSSRELTVKLSLKKVLIPGLAVVAVVIIALALRLLLPRHSQPLSVGAVDSIAVLPFENLSRDSSQDYFSDGMADELISKLYVISSLRVPPFRSIKDYRATKKTYREIAAELKVKTILDAGVLRVGDRVRITAKLIDPATERPLWTGNYERELKDILALQSEISQAIVREIRVQVTPQESEQLKTARRVDPEAYEACLRGIYFANKWTADGIKKAIAQFQHSIDIDPAFASAYAGLAGAYKWSAMMGLSATNEAFPRARAAAQKALGLDEHLAEAHIALAAVMCLFEWNWAGAEQEYRQAITLNPSSSEAHFGYGFYLTDMGRTDEAINETKRALDLDPLTPTTSLELGWVLYYARRHDESIAQLKKTLDLAPEDLGYAHMELSWNYAQKRMYPEAVAECRRAIRLSPDDQVVLGSCGGIYGLAGERTEALKCLESLKGLLARGYADPYNIAMLYDGLGEDDCTLEWLERAYRERSVSLCGLRMEIFSDRLRSNPRFQELLRRMNFPQ